MWVGSGKSQRMMLTMERMSGRQFDSVQVGGARVDAHGNYLRQVVMRLSTVAIDEYLLTHDAGDRVGAMGAAVRMPVDTDVTSGNYDKFGGQRGARAGGVAGEQTGEDVGVFLRATCSARMRDSWSGKPDSVTGRRGAGQKRGG